MAFTEGEEIRCAHCRAGRVAFDRARSFAVYEEKPVRAILLLKFDRIGSLGEWFAARLAEVLVRHKDLMAADLVVPAPVHRARQEEERGYNQAELLSRPLARLLNLPHRGVLPLRTKPRPDKHILTLHERWDRRSWRFCHTPRQPS